jgi:D-alanyl-D-alanine carboxypeptidase/D-alanyl-D-alanine-endopeptidase (penicillin-binding protein 4)
MRSKSLLNRTSLCFAFTIIAATTAQAGVRMNSMCFLQNKDKAEVTAFNPTKSEVAKSKFLKKFKTSVNDEDLETKFRIASLSKVLTSHWAIAKLGPEYRFETKIYVTPGVGPSSCNLHFEGDMDPYMGREMLGTVFPQVRAVLKERKCTTVDTVSYDENFRVLLDVMKHQSDESYGWNNPAPFVKVARTDADFKAYLQYKSQLKYNPKNVGPISKERYHEYLKEVPYKLYSFKSRPLHMILRDFNKFSFNYPPEILFQKLGGHEAYGQFIHDRLGFTENAVEMYNGSGYPVATEDSQVYNLVNCTALVKIIQDLDSTLANFKGSRTYQLADVMAVGGPEETYSTFKNLYASGTFKNTLVAKTGSANLAITFGGMLSTKEGHLYFAVLTRPDVYGGRDTDNARFYIRDLVQTLTNRNTLVRFPYEQIGNMAATDKASTLTEIKQVVGPATVPQPLIERPLAKAPAKTAEKALAKAPAKKIQNAKAKINLKKS